MSNCSKCGKELPKDHKRVYAGKRVYDHEAWMEKARTWCRECQKKFLREMDALEEKYHEAVDTQDGNAYERDLWSVFKRKQRPRMPPGLSISGHKRTEVS